MTNESCSGGGNDGSGGGGDGDSMQCIGTIYEQFERRQRTTIQKQNKASMYSTIVVLPVQHAHPPFSNIIIAIISVCFYLHEVGTSPCIFATF